MITETQSNLIYLLKACGLDKETTVSITCLCETDEKRQMLIDAIIYRYDQKGEVTEQDIQKMCLMINGSLKPEYKASFSK